MDIIDSFNRLPIGKYMEIQAIAKDESLEEIERQAQILSVLTGETEDEIAAAEQVVQQLKPKGLIFLGGSLNTFRKEFSRI